MSRAGRRRRSGNVVHAHHAEKIYDLNAARNRFARGVRLTCNGQSSAQKLKELLAPYRQRTVPGLHRVSQPRCELRNRAWRRLAREPQRKPPAVPVRVAYGAQRHHSLQRTAQRLIAARAHFRQSVTSERFIAALNFASSHGAPGSPRLQRVRCSDFLTGGRTAVSAVLSRIWASDCAW